ncbi:hypothetical protein RRG08_041397 [Elysia crispata]|uniref:Uncharacterized protein n=1 Tax=Elysia crispata TaxID=231223 RepID=A0AAE1CKQ7_9GAST|nr:hypothetical protein RRG08_041397 [Elysia crispata]
MRREFLTWRAVDLTGNNPTGYSFNLHEGNFQYSGLNQKEAVTSDFPRQVIIRKYCYCNKPKSAWQHLSPTPLKRLVFPWMSRE